MIKTISMWLPIEFEIELMKYMNMNEMEPYSSNSIQGKKQRYVRKNNCEKQKKGKSEKQNKGSLENKGHLTE